MNAFVARCRGARFADPASRATRRADAASPFTQIRDEGPTHTPLIGVRR